MKLSDYVLARVAQAGADHVFMLPGGGCMHLVDSLGRNRELGYTVNLHEQACAVAADAYAQCRNGLGVALVTTGPGGSNALTGVAASYLDSIPVLILSGQVKRGDFAAPKGVRQLGFQELDIVAMASPVTKYAAVVTDPAQIRRHLDLALHLARDRRPGPVWLDLPLDVQAAEVEPDRLEGWTPAPPPDPDQAKLAQSARTILGLLAGARRPAILVGNGVRHARAERLFLDLAETLGVPVLPTWKAADLIPDDHPLHAGRPGAAGQRAANFTQQNADWLLVLGARLDYGQVAYMHATFAPGAAKIVVDIDPAEIGKLAMPLAHAVCADCGDLLRALAREAAALPRAYGHRPEWLERIRSWRERYPVVLPEYWKARKPVNNYVLVEAISRNLRAGDLVVPGSSGACSELTCQAIRLPASVRMLNSQGLGPMGFCIPAALGACIASGGRRTIAIDGDGGFQMNVQELETVRRLGLPITFFVLDNQGYGSIRQSQRNYFQGRMVASDAGSGLTLPDPVRVAEAYGIPALRLASQEGLVERVGELLDQPGPRVVAVAIDPDQPTQPRAVSYQRPDGTMATRPMEDLFPLLDRAELEANMIRPEDR